MHACYLLLLKYGRLDELRSFSDADEICEAFSKLQLLNRHKIRRNITQTLKNGSLSIQLQAAAPSSAKPKAGPKSKTQQPSAAAAAAEAESTPSGPRSAKRNSSYMVDSDSDADDDPLTGGGSAKKKDKKANDSADDDYQPGLDINLNFFATKEWCFLPNLPETFLKLAIVK